MIIDIFITIRSLHTHTHTLTLWTMSQARYSALCFMNCFVRLWLFSFRLSSSRFGREKKSTRKWENETMEWYMVTCFNLESIASAIIFRFMLSFFLLFFFIACAKSNIHFDFFSLLPCDFSSSSLSLPCECVSVQLCQVECALCLFAILQHFWFYQLNRDDIYFFRVCHCILLYLFGFW